MLYIIISFINDTLLLSMDAIKNEKIVYNVLSIYTIIEYTIFSLFIHSILSNKLFKTLIIIFSAAFYLFAVLYFFLARDIRFDSLSASLESILIVSYCIFYLFDQLNKPQIIFIYQEPNFWFIVGFMVYLAGTLFLFIQANNLDSELRKDFWKINLSANTIKNILFAIAFSRKKSENLFSDFENQYDDLLEHKST